MKMMYYYKQGEVRFPCFAFLLGDDATMSEIDSKLINKFWQK